MKTLQKSLIDKLPKTVFVKSDLSHLFPEDYEPFAEKNVCAKEMLSKAKFPEGFGLR
jgi:abortive infection bacteriophage resistance protein